MNRIKKLCIPIVTACLIMNSMTFPALAKCEIPVDSEKVVVEEETTEEENAEQEENTCEEEASESVSDTEEDVSEEASDQEKDSKQEEIFIADETIVSDDVEALEDLGEVTINPAYFPDDNFREYIISNFDKNKDKVLNKEELTLVKEISLEGYFIQDISGIEYLPYLISLNAAGTYISSIDVSNNINLEKLNVSETCIDRLNVSNNVKLIELKAYETWITDIDLTKNINLETLGLSQSCLESLNVTNNTKLKELHANSMDISTIDVSHNTNLETLDLMCTSISYLDVSKLIKLKYLYLYECNDLKNINLGNKPYLTVLDCEYDRGIKSLDLSMCPKLKSLSCRSNSLETLDLSNNPMMEELWAADCWIDNLILGSSIEWRVLEIDRCHINTLDLTKYKKMRMLDISYTNISSIDITYCPYLIDAYEKGKYTKSNGVVKYSRYLDDEVDKETTDEGTHYYYYHEIVAKDGINIIKGEPKVTVVFDDIPENAWYVPAIQYVYNNKLMTGTNGGKSFSPNSNITRGMITTVLYSNEGKPATSIANPFSDVKDGAWYYNAVLWAKEKGVADGKSDGTFGPNNNITRQDLALMLYAYAQYKNYNLDKNDDALNGFSDAGKISGYAKNAMTWAVTQGILTGKGGRLDPAGKATRAEFAQMIMKLLQKNQK